MITDVLNYPTGYSSEFDELALQLIRQGILTHSYEEMVESELFYKLIDDVMTRNEQMNMARHAESFITDKTPSWGPTFEQYCFKIEYGYRQGLACLLDEFLKMNRQYLVSLSKANVWKLDLKIVSSKLILVGHI